MYGLPEMKKTLDNFEHLWPLSGMLPMAYIIHILYHVSLPLLIKEIAYFQIKLNEK